MLLILVKGKSLLQKFFSQGGEMHHFHCTMILLTCGSVSPNERAVDLHTPHCFLMPLIQIHCVGERASSGARRFCLRLHQDAYITSRSTQGRRAPSRGASTGMRAYSQQQFMTGVALLCSEQSGGSHSETLKEWRDLRLPERHKTEGEFSKV